jgi:siroheme synthase-like protein
MLDGARLDALVVGGGRVAARKVAALLAAGATVRLVAPEVTPELAARADTEPRLTILRRAYRSGDIEDAAFVVAATSERGVNARVAADARGLRRLVNVVDRPAEGNCITPATHRAGDVVVAVVAGGVPSAAARIRDLVAERIDARYAEAVRALGALRARVLADGGADAWRAATAALVAEDFCAAVETGRLTERAARWR